MRPDDARDADEQLTVPGRQSSPYWPGADPPTPPPPPRRRGPGDLPPPLWWGIALVLALALVTVGEHAVAGRWPWQGTTGAATANVPNRATTMATATGIPGVAPMPTASATAAPSATPDPGDDCTGAGFDATPATTGNKHILFTFPPGTVGHITVTDQDVNHYQGREFALCVAHSSPAATTDALHTALAAGGWARVTPPAEPGLNCETDCWRITQTSTTDPLAQGVVVYAGLTQPLGVGAASTLTLRLTVAPYRGSVPFMGDLSVDAGGNTTLTVLSPHQFQLQNSTTYAPFPAGVTLDSITCQQIAALPLHQDVGNPPITVGAGSFGLQPETAHFVAAFINYTSPTPQFTWVTYPFCLD